LTWNEVQHELDNVLGKKSMKLIDRLNLAIIIIINLSQILSQNLIWLIVDT